MLTQQHRIQQLTSAAFIWIVVSSGLLRRSLSERVWASGIFFYPVIIFLGTAAQYLFLLPFCRPIVARVPVLLTVRESEILYF